MFQIPALHCISCRCIPSFMSSSTFPFHNLLSYSLGQIRIYPFLSRFAKKNGVEDTSVIIEAYEANQPIHYYLVLEKLNLFTVLKNEEPIPVTSL